MSVFLEHQIFDVARDGDRHVSVDARDARSGRETRFRGAMFIDCTGTAILGLLAGAETMFGYESRAEPSSTSHSLRRSVSGRTTATPVLADPGNGPAVRLP